MREDIAKALLDIKAVFFRPEDPFIWASGIKSPIYCDNRLTLSDARIRTLIESALADIIRKQYPEVQILMGTATAGIAHAAIVAHLLNLPMGYVRSASKDHGRKNRIEGRLNKEDKVVIIEDLISTGSSVIDTAEALRQESAQVLGVASIFTYNMQSGLNNLRSADLKNYSITDFDSVAKTAVDEGYIKSDDYDRLIAFRNNPSDESWIGGN